MLCNFFKQDHYSTVGGDRGCRVSEVRAGATSPMPDHKGLSYSHCQRSTDSISKVKFQKFSTLMVKLYALCCILGYDVTHMYKQHSLLAHEFFALYIDL